MQNRLALVCLTLLWLGACSNEPAQTRTGSNLPTVTLGEQKSGQATYYDTATGDGACMLGASPNDMDIAALNQPDWSGSALCGACAEVTGPKGVVTVRIVDLCPECKSGDLDMSPQAFDKIAEHAAGRVAITWKLVSCNVSGPVQYLYKDGSSQWWTAVQVRNHRLPVASFAFSKDGGSVFTELARTEYNYFLTEAGFGPNPVRVRITASDGQVLEDDLPAARELIATAGKAQFK
jgi:expansin (peptidoglycan-binding protein)